MRLPRRSPMHALRRSASWAAGCGLVGLFGVGCYEPLELPLLDEIPIEGEPVAACDSERDARVACILDGDTFDVDACGEDLGERIRMLGVSAPEIAHNESEVSECWGDEATAELERILAGREVTLTFDVDCTGLYGRTLAYVWLVGDEFDHLANEPDIEDFLQPLHAGDEELSLLVNEWLVYRGHARVFEEDIFGTLIYQDRLEAAQSRAEQAGRGLWGACESGGG